MAVVYALLDPTNNEVRYVGYTRFSPDIRLRKHIESARSGKRRWVYNWIRKLMSMGATPELKILETTDGDDISREIYWIQHGKENGWKLTNATSGGEGTVGYEFTDEVRNKLREKSIAMWQNDEIRKKIISSRIGHKHSEETRKKMSESMRGKKRSEEACKNIGNSKRGIKASDETRKKISDHWKGRNFTDEHRKKISDGLTGNKNNLGHKTSEETKEKIRESRRLFEAGTPVEKRRSHHAKK